MDIDESSLDGGLYAYGGQSVIACSIAFIVLCTIVLVLRFWAHNTDGRRATLEDWILIPAWFLMMGMCINVIIAVTMGGVGRHEAFVLKFQPESLRVWAQTLFITELFYGVLIPLEKSTVLLLYVRLFGVHRWFRRLSYGMIVYIWMWGITELIVAIAQCQPVAFQWDKTIPGGHCINQLAYYRYISLPNVLHDVCMLIVPMPIVWKLQIEMRKKVALSIVFLVGSIGCIASFIRMYIFFKLDALSDNTWASIQLHSWTLAEPGAIFICACIPALWPMLLRALHVLGLSSHPDSAGFLSGKGSGHAKGGTGGGLGSHISGAGMDSSRNRHGASGVWTGRHGFGQGNDFIPLQDTGSEMHVVGEHTEHPEGLSVSRRISHGWLWWKRGASLRLRQAGRALRRAMVR
ncbi:hypothetical protein B0T17DRAFT_480937 [Bombardia bombarda]|uniref:Rhodopsin domain-containing protein n=1 Tax=Bombardia bombarda TaxID=252184 RepID=A0AA39XNV5_9PEZI|nr:hypothetical protein B0T17DRAFT_480937 [Bombardia bombarda]